MSGDIQLPYELYKSVLEKSIAPELSFLIVSSDYNGVCGDNDIRMSVQYIIKVLNENSKPAAASAASASKLIIKLFSDRATLVKSVIQFQKSHGEDIVDGQTIGSCIIMNESHYNLYVNQVGRYILKLELSVPYLTTKNTGMELLIPKSSNNSVTFKVPKSESNIKIFNSFPDVTTCNDYTAKNGKEANDSTIVFAKLPGSERQLKIQWTVKEDIKPSSQTSTQINIKPNVVVAQYHLCSIGEGLIIFKSQFNYNIISGVISLYNIAFDKNMNIINVEGDAVKKWEVVDNERPESPNHTKLLQVYLDYGVEGNYKLTVSSESSMKDTSGDALIYSMICKGDEISRQRGFLAVEARTNVEISELSSSESLNVVDIQELPPQLHVMASHPILLSYKFLEQNYALSLRVKKNSDCAVLVSICEEAHFLTTVSYSGKTLHTLILKIKNSKQQYVKINIPFKYDVWSTLMDGIPIKPSLEGSYLLIPILKPGNSDQQNAIQIEIIILEQEPKALSKKGSYQFTMPKIDLQLRAAFATIYMPNGFKCSNYSGNLKNVSYFSSTPPSSGAAKPTYAPTSSNRADHFNRRASITKMSFSMKKERSYEQMDYVEKKRKNGAGKIPVQIDSVTTDCPFYFEQILLSGGKDLNIKFDYVAPK
ncbi:hypothetical protein DLAC_11273 [Tieghemostelium lacteum]|uniref:Uncharacterized protein n=1 Tax=Tieghemostelium lacteum TaxID=361077 RepID=A0A151Z3R1_TIELA|nr:hypothetical protein DLAC_11273 [Tieghemostelium lacteum]|eukprot:KYQ88547.1 hypothetical protein DLAC_11273 [Tieghemostelium lacteum]